MRRSFRRSLIVSHMAQLRFNCRAIGMGNIRHLFYLFHVHIIGICGTVIHDRGEAQLQGFQAGFFPKAVVKMDDYRHFGLLCHRDQVIGHFIQRAIGEQHLRRTHDDR